MGRTCRMKRLEGNMMQHINTFELPILVGHCSHTYASVRTKKDTSMRSSSIHWVKYDAKSVERLQETHQKVIHTHSQQPYLAWFKENSNETLKNWSRSLNTGKISFNHESPSVVRLSAPRRRKRLARRRAELRWHATDAFQRVPGFGTVTDVVQRACACPTAVTGGGDIALDRSADNIHMLSSLQYRTVRDQFRNDWQKHE